MVTIPDLMEVEQHMEAPEPWLYSGRTEAPVPALLPVTAGFFCPLGEFVRSAVCRLDCSL